MCYGFASALPMVKNYAKSTLRLFYKISTLGKEVEIQHDGSIVANLTSAKEIPWDTKRDMF